MCAVSSFAVTVSDVAGTFKGNLNIGGTMYADKQVYILPGVTESTITFVLPDFTYNGASLGDIVLVDIPMDATGKLTLDDATLYIRAISERAGISVLNGLEDGGVTYNSIISASQAQVLLSIEAPSLPEPIFVLFAGTKVTDKNYAVNNGGFEGNWTSNEPSGWHSFPSATGTYSSMVTGNTEQFQRSTDVRPGSTGTHSIMMRSNLLVGVKANGNCTNGQINAGSMSADDASGNYNFSDPSNSNYNTPFVGNPDSLVFWSKYIPADQNPSNSVNKARAHAVVTTNARYQDPESGDYSSVKVADAAVNYSATSSMGWQRIAVPFTYTQVSPSQAAYVLITFTTNMTPGGGSTYSSGSLFNKTYYYDNVYVDDVEMIYNHGMQSVTMDGTPLTFADGQCVTHYEYSDEAYDFAVTTDGKAAKSFIGYDALHNRVHIYVVGHNYSQAKAYSVYTLQMATPVPPVYDTEYAYTATTCEGEPYSDELFTNLTEAGVYVDTLVNYMGADSIVTLTLNVLPTYLFATQGTMYLGGTYSWQGKTYSNLPGGIYYDTIALKTASECDSVLVLALTVKDTPVTYGAYEAVICDGESVTYDGVEYDEAFDADVLISQPNSFGGDSIVRLTVTLLPSYVVDEYMTINVGDNMTWGDWNLSTMPVGQMDLEAYYYTVEDCDSTIVLHLTILPEGTPTDVNSTTGKNARFVQKMLYNGNLYIIREDESVYTIFGTKVK